LSAIALAAIAVRSIALAVKVLPFCHGSPAGKKITFAAIPSVINCSAA
jgi:hypothetical protein